MILDQMFGQVDEEELGGLRGLAEVLLNYGERHFDGVHGQKGAKRGVWAGVLVMCGQFERVSSHVVETKTWTEQCVRLSRHSGTTMKRKLRLYISRSLLPTMVSCGCPRELRRPTSRLVSLILCDVSQELC